MTQSHRRALTRLTVLAVVGAIPAVGVAPAQAAAGTPSAPPSVTVVPSDEDDGAQLVTWEASTPASSRAGDAIAAYEVDWTLEDDVVDAVVPVGKGRRYVTPGLGSGTNQVSVAAVDKEGDRSPLTVSEPFEVAEPYQLAGSTSVEASETSPATVDVSWVAPAVPEGREDVTRYRVTLSNQDDQGDDARLVVPVEHTSATLEDVDQGTYEVVVVAFDARDRTSAGRSEQLLEVEGHVAPDGPSEVTASQTGPGELYVAWEQPADDHGFTIADYVVEVRPNGGQGVSPPPVVVPADERLDAVLSEVPVGTYDIAVTARSDGEPAITVLEDVTVVPAPGAVGSLSVQQTAPGTVVVSWTAPTDSAGAVTGYAVGYGQGQSGNGFEVGATTFTRTITNLRPGTYRFGVRALAGEVPGAASSSTLVVTNTTKRGAPTLKVADPRLKRGQKLKVGGKASPRAQLQLEIRTAGSPDFLVLRDLRATNRGTYTLTAALPEPGAVRVVDVATGRVSPAVDVTITATGR